MPAHETSPLPEGRPQGSRKHKRRTAQAAPAHARSASTGSGSTGARRPGATGDGAGHTGRRPGPDDAPGRGRRSSPPESPTGPAAPARVQVTAEDTEVQLRPLAHEVPAGKVIIEFVNHGQDEHNLHAIEPSEGSEAGSLPNTAPGAHPDLTLNLRPGSYTLFCSLPEHEAKGMKATLVVQ